MTESIKKSMAESVNLAERYSSGFDLREFGLSQDQEHKVAEMFSERVKFLFKEAVECYLGALWHPGSEIPQDNVSGLMVVYKDKTCDFINMDEVPKMKSLLDVVCERWLYLADLQPSPDDVIVKPYKTCAYGPENTDNGQ